MMMGQCHYMLSDLLRAGHQYGEGSIYALQDTLDRQPVRRLMLNALAPRTPFQDDD